MKRLFSLFLILFALGCNYSNQHIPPAGAGMEPSEDLGLCEPGEGSVDPEAISFEEVRSQVFEMHCFSCHGNGQSLGGVNLETHSAAAPWAELIEFDVVNNIMPKNSPPLPQGKKDIVIAWVQSGAPNIPGEGCIEEEPTEEEESLPEEEPFDPDAPLTEMPPDNAINFELIREKIFKVSCFACHSDSEDNFTGLVLETYSGAFEELEDIEEEILKGDMPPPPRPALEEIPRRVLLRWIELGGPR